MFEIIRSLKPYFFSLREIDGNVSLDLKFPITWKIDTIVTPYRSIKTKTQDKNDKYNLVSLIANATNEGYDIVLTCANEIIDINKEEEEKRRLFQQKVNELKVLFENQSLDKLKDINFLESNGQEDTTGIRMVGQRDEEGREGDIREEIEDD